MRLLIVDCFTSTRSGRERFEDFKGAIEGALRGPYYKFLPEIGIAVRSGKNLKDFIFDVDGLYKDGSYNDSSSLRAFQNLDMVFIGGDDTGVLPWADTAKPLRMLLKQCFSYSVPTFTCGFPAHFVTYTVMLNGVSVKVFNGRGRGGTKSELREMPIKVRNKISPSECFLDAETGDFYQKEEFGVFAQKGNVGLFNTLRKQAPNLYKTRPSVVRGDDPDPTRNDEVVLEIANARLQQHWLFEKISKKRFLAPKANTWAIHDKINPRIQVYCVSRPNALPELICLDHTIYGCQFLISRKYPDTAQILWNWTSKFCEEIRKAPGKRLGSVGADILNPVIFTNEVTTIWDDMLDEEFYMRREQKKKMLQGENEAADAGAHGGIGNYPSRSFTASRSQWDDEFFDTLTKSLEQLRGKTPSTAPAGVSRGSAGLGSRVPTGDARGGSAARSAASRGGKPGSAGYAEDFKNLFHGGSTWPDGGADPSANMTIEKTLVTHDVPVLQSAKTFDRVEIRRMLHPEADISEIAPFTPFRQVRVNTVKKPYTRWKYFEELEVLERYNQNPQLWAKTYGFAAGQAFSAGGENIRPANMSRPHTDQGQRGGVGSRGGTGSSWRNEKLGYDQKRPQSVPENLHSPTNAMRKFMPSVREGTHPPLVYPASTKQSAYSSENHDRYVQHITRHGASVLEKSAGVQDIDYYGHITDKPLTAPGGPFKRPRGVQAPDSRPPFVPHVPHHGRNFKHVPNYVNKTPGPLLTEHKFREASNVGGGLKDFLPVGTRTGGWEKSAVDTFPASHKALYENEKNLANHAFEMLRNVKTR